MYRCAVLCLLLAGCGVAHASSVKIRRIKRPKPAAVEQSAAGEHTPSTPPQAVEETPAAVDESAAEKVDWPAKPQSSDSENSPPAVANAPAADPISEAVKREKERQATEFEKRVIDIISQKRVGDDPSPPPAPPEPPPLPPSPPVAPILTLPANIEGDVGDFIEIVPQTNLKAVHYYVIDKGLKKLPDSVALEDHTIAVVQAMSAGSYRVIAVGASADEIVGPVEVMVVVHGAQPPPVPPTPPVPPPQPVPVPPPLPVPPPGPPAPPPTPAASKLWVVIAVNNSTSVDPVTAGIIGDVSFWNSFRAQGHDYKVYNSTQPEYQKYKDIVAKNCDGKGHCGTPAIIIMDADKAIAGIAPWLNQGSYSNGASLTGIPGSGTAGVKSLINRYTSRQVP